jgi:arsenate reductase
MKRTVFLILAIGFHLASSCTSSQSEKVEKTTDPKVPLETSSPTKTTPITMTPTIQSYIESISGDIQAIPEDRKKELKKLALYIKTKKKTGEDANLIFICTHNSRRSHMSQLWASTAAAYYGVSEGIHTYSGGTEVTAFNPRAVAAMERAGFIFEKPVGDNPSYIAKFAADGPEFSCWSKKYDDPANPQENFAAIMTCSEADKNCPFIPGASLRSPIKYEDPKEFDGTPDEQKAYDERCRQIASEMFFLMSEVSA